MKTAIIAALALAWSSAFAVACDTYTSAEKPPGVRVLTDEGFTFFIKEGQTTTHYETGSAGTGTGIRLGFPDDGSEPIEIAQSEGEFWVGPEKFIEACE